MLRRIRNQGAPTSRDIDDDVLVEKDHAWASRKPSATSRSRLVQQWTWIGKRKNKQRIEEALHRFERFQLAM